jgi:uncharacterized protein
VKRALIDAGPVIALFDKTDLHHHSVLKFLKKFEGRLLTTWPVITEISYMLDFNEHVRLDFLSWVINGGIEMIRLKQNDLIRIREILDKYSDLPADFADASLLTAAENERIGDIITIDRDFSIYRLSAGRVLDSLL